MRDCSSGWQPWAGGTAHFVVPGESLSEALRGIAQEIGDPVLTQIRFQPLHGELEELVPDPIPDVFSGRNIGLIFRSAQAFGLRIHAQDSQGESWTAELQTQTILLDAIRQIWARRRLHQLEEPYRAAWSTDPQLAYQIIAPSCEQQVLSRLTALVAIDKEEPVNPEGEYRTVIQSVELPELWSENNRSLTGAVAPLLQSQAAPPPPGGAPEKGPSPSATRDSAPGASLVTAAGRIPAMLPEPAEKPVSGHHPCARP